MRTNGVMIATDPGMVTGYALANLQERGALFVVPGQQVYVGQIVGEFSRENDVNVNVCKEKKLTNMRASGSDKSIILHPAREMTLEMLLEYVSEDELVEITPAEIRLRKRMLNETDRKRSRRPN